MLSCITNAGIGNPGSLTAFIELAARHGIQGVDTGGDALQKLVSDIGLEGARALLATQGVRIGAMSLSVNWRTDEATFQQGLPKLAAHAQVAAELGCGACCTYVLPSVDDEAARYAARAARRLRHCARILGMYNIRLGLEFVGPHHLRTKWKNLFLYDMPGMLEFIEAVGESNVGLLLDAFHWYTTGSDQAALDALKVDQIVHVHVNDAPQTPVEQALDNDRLFPGDGVIDLRSFMDSLRRKGYSGFVSLEVLSKDPLPGDPEFMAAKAATAFRRIMG